MIRRASHLLLAFVAKIGDHLERIAIESADHQIERTLQRIARGEPEPLLSRMMDHPVGFCILFFGGILVALGLAEILCALLGAPFDPRIG